MVQWPQTICECGRDKPRDDSLNFATTNRSCKRCVKAVGPPRALNAPGRERLGRLGVVAGSGAGGNDVRLDHRLGGGRRLYRSEARRVGKEGVGTWKLRWSA